MNGIWFFVRWGLIFGLLMFVNPGQLFAQEREGAATKSQPDSTEEQQAPDEVEEKQVEEIVITGIHSSIEASLNTKRESDAIVDAISAEDIGKFPDENVAESLQRITGLSITRGFGEGESVSIRGLGPGRNLTLLNGQGVASSHFFLEDFEFSRGFNFSLLPSELVSSVKVYKSPEAQLQEGGVGGTIVLNTRQPLDLEPYTIAASAALGYSDLSETLDPRATLLASWKNHSETFGILVAGVYQKRTLRRDAIEVLFYDQADIDVGGDGDIEAEDVFYPGIIGSALFQQERIRTTGLTTIQFKPIEKLKFTLTGLYSRLSGANTNHNYLSLQFLNPLSGPGSVVQDAVIRDNTAVFLDLADNPDGVEVELDSIYRDSKLHSYSYDLKTEWIEGLWTISNHTGYTRATGGRGDLLFTSFLTDTAYTSDLRDGIGAVNYAQTTTDPSTLDRFGTFRDNFGGAQQQFYTQVDLERQLNSEIFRSVQVGIQYRDQYQDRRRIVGDLKAAAGFDSLDEISNQQTPGDFLDNIAGPDGLTRYVYPDIERLAKDLPISAYAFRDDPGFFFKVSEQITALYTQGNIVSEIGDMGIRGNIGVRYVYTDVTSRARRSVDDEIVQYKDKNDYGEVLPSVNLAFNVYEDMYLRLAAARVLNRPAYTELSPAVDLNETLFTGTGGNPDLEPFKANQYDLAFEWYFDQGSAVSVALFYKDIMSFVALEAREEEHKGSTFRITRPFNGRGGNTYGLEAAFQQVFEFLPKPFDGLGTIINYTFSDSQSSLEDPQTGSKLPIPGQSKHNFNVILFFEKGPFATRLAYNYRTKYFEQIDRGGARHADDFGQLDANLTFDIFENLSVFAEGLNLTNETVKRFVGEPIRPFQHMTTGRRFFLGVRGKY